MADFENEAKKLKRENIYINEFKLAAIKAESIKVETEGGETIAFKTWLGVNHQSCQTPVSYKFEFQYPLGASDKLAQKLTGNNNAMYSDINKVKKGYFKIEYSDEASDNNNTITRQWPCTFGAIQDEVEGDRYDVVKITANAIGSEERK